MNFNDNMFGFDAGRIIGFLLAYSVFTCFLYLILALTKKDAVLAPLITLGVAVIGLIVKRLLK